MHDPFLHDIYTSNEAEEYFSKIVGEEMRWLSNSWDASHMNVQEKTGLDTKIFDWHMDSQPLTLIINVSDMPPPEEIIGGSTILRKHDDGSEIELKQPAPGKSIIVNNNFFPNQNFFISVKKEIYHPTYPKGRQVYSIFIYMLNLKGMYEYVTQFSFPPFYFFDKL